MNKSKLIKDSYMWILTALFTCVLCAQFYVSSSFVNNIETSNYFALIFSSLIFCLFTIPLTFSGKVNIGWGDIAIFLFFIYIVVNSYLNNSIDTTEFRMTAAYFSLYFAFKFVNEKYPKFIEYAIVAIMLTGIYQSVLVLRQLYGFDYSNHNRFAVTGSFYNPGPCGIFLSAILVLAVASIKNCQVKRSITYITAYATIIATLLAILPTMSRAGWIGAAVGILLVYSKTIIHFLKFKRIITIAIIVVAVGVVLGIYAMKKDSADGRFFMWSNGITAFSKAPIMGVGIGNFAENYSEAQYQYFLHENVLTQENKNIDVVGVPTSVFNEVLSLTLLLGAVGLGFGIFILYRKVSLSPMSCVAFSIIVSSLFSYTFYIPITGVIFVYAIACMKDRRQFAIPSLVFLPLLLLPLVNHHVLKEMKARKEWKSSAMFYSMNSYDVVCEDYPALLDVLNKDYKFMFEYGHSLNKEGKFKESNDILLTGAKRSTDPMFWTIIGNNYLGLEKYDKSEEAYLRAYYLCPNRLYPIYLLTKLFDKAGDKDKSVYYGNILLNKKPKVKSAATDEMKKEVSELLNCP